MVFSFKNLCGYLLRHPRFLTDTLADVFKLYRFKISRKKIAVITTGSGGIGDYLWIRNYMPLLRKDGYSVVLIAMSHWREFIECLDKENVDIVRYFESCQSPKKLETFFFKHFTADVFLNFRTASIGNYVKSKCEYSDIIFLGKPLFYEEKNNYVFSQYKSLPQGFKHKIPIIDPEHTLRSILDSHKPYVVLVEGGNTQGKLSDEQLKSVSHSILDHHYDIFFNGDTERLKSLLDTDDQQHLIDGRILPFVQHIYAVANSAFVVTVNTSIYHFALQLQKPCVVISANEYETIKLDAPKQLIIFNKDLQIAYEKGNLQSHKKNKDINLDTIESKRIVDAINEISNTVI